MAAQHGPSLHKGSRCREIANPDIANFVLAVFILIGILVSYLPQHYRIISRRSSEGLSPWFILLGTVSGTCAIANILVLPTSRDDIACCAVNSSFSCAAGLLGIAQIGVQWSCFFLITLLFLIFIPRSGSAPIYTHNSRIPADSAWRQAVVVVAVAIVHFIFTFFASVIILAKYPQHLLIFANILGTTSSILASIQYIPQIWETWKNKHIGSLSIPMMCIQTPGSYVFAASLAIRLGTKGWSAWTVYIVTGSLQAILLAMAIIFAIRDRKSKYQVLPPTNITDPIDRSGDSDDEADPLLEHDRLAKRQRMLSRRASHPLDPDKLNPEGVSSDENDGETSKQKGGASTLATMASNIAGSIRRGSTKYYDALSGRKTGPTNADEEYVWEGQEPSDPGPNHDGRAQNGMHTASLNAGNLGRSRTLDGRTLSSKGIRSNTNGKQRATSDN